MLARTWAKALEYAALMARNHNAEVVVMTGGQGSTGAVEYVATVAGSSALPDLTRRGFRPHVVVRHLRPANRAVTITRFEE